jgi:5-methylcytosine-specific restriction endonuclease McrA
MKRTSTDNDRRSVGPKRQGLNAKVSRFDHPPPFICLNCDQPFEVTGQVKLFCSELCKEEAKFVRYFRRCSHDGRINQVDVQEALEIRFAHIMVGGYPAQERQVPASMRAKVIARDKGVCRQCSEAGTTIDHIDGDANEMENLQLLCSGCHNAKTRLRISEITSNDERYPAHSKKAKLLRFRCSAPRPVRPCDDNKLWPARYKEIMAEWRKARRNDPNFGDS